MLTSSVDQKNSDGIIKQLLNSIVAKYRDLSMSRRSIICLSLRLRQIIDLLASDKSRYVSQPRSIVNCLFNLSSNRKWGNYTLLFWMGRYGIVQKCVPHLHLSLLGTNGFHTKAKNERFIAAGLRCRIRTSKMKISRRRLAHYEICRGMRQPTQNFNIPPQSSLNLCFH